MRITGYDSGIGRAGNGREGNSRGVSQSARTVRNVNLNPGPAKGAAQSVLILARGLGLPADRLSASVVSSARYFSLPLEPGLLAKLRREVSAAGHGSTAATGKETGAAGKTEAAGLTASVREALSMAASAAASRGVALRPEALDEYAAAIDPGRRHLPGGERRDESPAGDAGGGGSRGGGRGRENGGGEGGGMAGGTSGGGGGEGGGMAGGTSGGGGGKGSGGTAAGRGSGSGNGGEDGGAVFPGAGRDPAAAPAALRERVLETAEQIPLLRLLNRIPGKDGRRWIVLPFSFAEGGREYGVSLRIMLEGDRCRMALDMTEGQNGEILRRRLFVMERAPGEAPALSVSLRPGRREAELRSLKKRLETCLGLSRDHIRAKNADNKTEFSWFFPQDCLLPSIDEEV